MHFMAASVLFEAGRQFGIESIAKRLKVDAKVNGSAKDSFEAHENFFEALTVALLRQAFVACASKLARAVNARDVFAFLVR